MDERKEQGWCVGNYTEGTVEISDENGTVKSETLGVLSQSVSEVDGTLKDSFNGDDNMEVLNSLDHTNSIEPVEKPIDVERNSGVDGSSELYMDNTVRSSEGEVDSDTKDSLGSIEKPEEDGVKKSEIKIGSIVDEATDSSKKPENEAKIDESRGGEARAAIKNGEAAGEENGPGAEESEPGTVDGETLLVNVENFTVDEGMLSENQALGAEDVTVITVSVDGERNELVEKSAEEGKRIAIDPKVPIQEEKCVKAVVLRDDTEDPCSETVDATALVAGEDLNVAKGVAGDEATKFKPKEVLDLKHDDPVADSGLTANQGLEAEAACEEAQSSCAMDACPAEQEHVINEGEAMEIDRGCQIDSNTSKEMEIDKQDIEEQHGNLETSDKHADGIVSADSTIPDHASRETVTGNEQLKETETRAESVERVGGVAAAPSQELQEPGESFEDPKLVEARDVALSDSNIVKEMKGEARVAGSEGPSPYSEGGNKAEEQSDQNHVTLEPEGQVIVAEGPKEASLSSNLDNSLSLSGNDQNSGKVQECLDKNVEHDVPDIDPNIGQDMKTKDQVVDAQNFDETGSDAKINDKKRKADSLDENSMEESRKAVSAAKGSVTTPQAPKPSFKIGACIARAASQMTGSPSILKNSNLSNENLSPENLLSQLHVAALDPSKDYSFLEVVTGFFTEYRNSLVPEQHPSDKVCGKRSRLSHSPEAFEFEDMSDTYWTDRVVNNGGVVEQAPPHEKGSYQSVPVELKAAQFPRARRPYKRRHLNNNNHNSNNYYAARDKPVGYVDENSPAELIMNFSETDAIPSETILYKMFRHFGPIRESQAEVDRDNSRARVVFKKCTDAEVAFNSAGKFLIFGSKVVQYELNYTITEHFKIQPYVVSLGEADATMCLPSQS